MATAAPAAEEALPRPSPDGRWLACQSNETGTWEIWVRPMAEPGGRKWQVSTQTGGAPLFWAHSGRELFYRDRTTDSLIAVQATGEAAFALGSRKALFVMPGPALAAIAPDDRRFLALRRVRGAEEPPELIVVKNVFEELRAKAGR